MNVERSEEFDETIVRLVAEHQTALRGFVMAMMPGSSEVDDVVQEANILVWRKRQEFEPGTNFRAWLLTVAKYQVMTAWKRQRGRKESLFPDEVLAKLADDAAAASGVASPDSRRKALWECLDHLRPVDKALVLRRYFDELNIKQLATEAERSADSVKMSLLRIRGVLAACVRRRLRPGQFPS